MKYGAEYRKIGHGIKITDFHGYDTDLEIPERIEKLPLIEIGNYAFRGCKNLKRITIPNSVTQMGIGFLGL